MNAQKRCLNELISNAFMEVIDFSNHCENLIKLKKNCHLSTLNALFSFCNGIEKRASDDVMHVSCYTIYLIKTKQTEY